MRAHPRFRHMIIPIIDPQQPHSLLGTLFCFFTIKRIVTLCLRFMGQYHIERYIFCRKLPMIPIDKSLIFDCSLQSLSPSIW